jgi:hypothetical protein
MWDVQNTYLKTLRPSLANRYAFGKLPHFFFNVENVVIILSSSSSIFQTDRQRENVKIEDGENDAVRRLPLLSTLLDAPPVHPQEYAPHTTLANTH